MEYNKELPQFSLLSCFTYTKKKNPKAFKTKATHISFAKQTIDNETKSYIFTAYLYLNNKNVEVNLVLSSLSVKTCNILYKKDMKSFLLFPEEVTLLMYLVNSQKISW